MAELVGHFLGADEAAAAEAYQRCFLSAEVAVALLAQPELLPGFLQKGLLCKLAFTSTLCAVRVRELTGLTMVASDTVFNQAWLYSMALAGQVDPGPVALGERQGDVAFALADVWLRAAGRPQLRGAQPAGGPEPAARVSGDVSTTATVPGGTAPSGAPERAQAMQEDESEDEAGPLAWEDEREALPADLAQVLARHSSGALQLDPRAWLEELPRWEGVKDRPELNNHRGDKEKIVDKVLRGVQAKVLGLQRMYPCLHSSIEGEEPTELGQKF